MAGEARTGQPESDSEALEQEQDERDSVQTAPAAAAPARPSAGPSALASFFRIYKPGQGYWTRLGTIAGSALVLVLVIQLLYTRLDLLGVPRRINTVVTAVIAIASALLLWRVLNKPSVVDFLIATESEMRKVNWTSRKDLFGSTKVVIFFMFLIAAALFCIDIVFGYFFHIIGVLQQGPFG